MIQRLNLRPGQVGLTLNKLPLQLLVALAGIPFGIAEFYILRPNPLVGSLAWKEVPLPTLILLVGTGFAKEFAFRGVMQWAVVDALDGGGAGFILRQSSLCCI